jgi:hypothetical protein
MCNQPENGGGARPTVGSEWIALPFRSLYDPLQQTGELSLALEQRKPTAILAADVVGYSRLIGRDESGTLARFHSATEQQKHLFQDRTNAKCRPGPEGSAVGG